MTSRLLNITLASFLLLLTGPLLLLVCLLIKWDSPGPVFERQLSIDLHRRRCTLLRFRTTEFNEHRPTWGRRVTHVGEILRLTRIDALPQLLNVLRGDIRLVDIQPESRLWLILFALTDRAANAI
jgi:lipopolysaccharide/colanic/teichoic acid biosynthesis glycosyltransferase